MSDLIEIGGYFFFFWLFLFSPNYRSLRLKEWRDGGSAERAFLLFEALVSILFGVLVPAFLIWAIVSGGEA
jgi:hypothetical protein